jgi:ribosomal protein S21|tara:strand:+ start:271 stop:492 length:222 start_codon:yes stop_codon:yes gene_type:complete
MASNVVVRPRRGEPAERMIRRFIKKCKKEKVIETYRARTDYYIKPSVKKRMKSEKARREKKKLQKKIDRKLFR